MFGNEFYNMYDLDINEVKPKLDKAIRSGESKQIQKVIRDDIT